MNEVKVSRYDGRRRSTATIISMIFIATFAIIGFIGTIMLVTLWIAGVI